MILVETMNQDYQYLLIYVRCLYVILCNLIVRTSKSILLLPLVLTLIDNSFFNFIGISTGLVLYVLQFHFSIYIPRYFPFIGCCLWALNLNFLLMSYWPGLMNFFPLKIIDYTILCSSIVLAEFSIVSLGKGKQPEPISTGPSLTGFEEITDEDEDF